MSALILLKKIVLLVVECVKWMVWMVWKRVSKVNVEEEKVRGRVINDLPAELIWRIQSFVDREVLEQFGDGLDDGEFGRLARLRMTYRECWNCNNIHFVWNEKNKYYKSLPNKPCICNTPLYVKCTVKYP